MNQTQGNIPVLFLIISLLVIMLCPLPALAQSDHYWSQNFNIQSSLVAGAVVGGYAGPGAVYYNPAMILQDDKSAFAISMRPFSFQFYNVENIGGKDVDMQRAQLKVQPRFISYVQSPEDEKNLNFEVAFLTNISQDLNFNVMNIDSIDIIKRLDGKEIFTGSISYMRTFEDIYVGGGVSKSFSDRWSIGLSGFFTYKYQRYHNIISSKAYQETDTVYANGVPEPFYAATNSFEEHMKLWNLGLIFKLGAFYQTGTKNFGFGINFTFPSINIYGEGDISKEYSRASVFNNETGDFTRDEQILGREEDVRARIKDPFSFAFGMEYKSPNRKNTFLLTAAYFHNIEVYQVFETTSGNVYGNVEVTNEALAMTYFSGADALVNVALGFVQVINEHFTLAGGFKTDFNNLAKVQGDYTPNIYFPQVGNIYLDKYHVVAGPYIEVKKFSAVLGIQYTWGRRYNMPNLINYADPVEYIPETGVALQGEQENNMNVKYNEISLFIGITYAFGKK
jgi:hypothetical protein